MKKINTINLKLLDGVQFLDGSFHLSNGGSGILYNPISQLYLFTDSSTDMAASTKTIKEPVKPVYPAVRKYRVEITENCTGGCSYCLVYKNRVLKQREDGMCYRDMPAETAHRIVHMFNEEVGSNGSIMIMGGEPLINWPAVAVFLENALGHVNIYTNGVGFTEKMADEVAKHDGRVYVSLDGAGAQANRFRVLKNGQQMLPYSLKSYDILRERGVKTAINMVVTDETVSDLRDHVAYFVEDLGCKTMGLTHPHFTEFADIPLDIGAYVSSMQNVFNYAKEHGVFVDQIAKRLQPIVDRKYRLIGCKSAGEQRTFKVDGSETVCTKIDAHPKTAFLTVEDIQKNLPVNSPYCHTKCIGEGSCGGGCYFDAAMLALESPADERECRITIGIVTKVLYDMLEEHEKGVDNFSKLYGDMLASFR
ncbi:MAG: radical SAM protein [Candidatus Aenigmatarchaeota archaeon]